MPSFTAPAVRSRVGSRGTVPWRGLGLVLALLAVPHALALQPGEPLPAFRLTSLDGESFDSAVLSGRVALIDFWASWCAPCVEALPELGALARRHADRGLSVVPVSIDHDASVAARFLSAEVPGAALRSFSDPRGELFARLGGQAIPALWVVDRRGIVRAFEDGYEPERLKTLEALVERLLAEPAR